MIHQMIFASPRPGMSEQEFHRYWVEEHAVRYASKIPQIRRYKVDTTVPFAPRAQGPLWSGVAEIWLRNEEEQLASLQTEEFLQGARLDEPRWAAFWSTLVLDTDAHTVVEPPARPAAEGVKIIRLVKRREGMPLGEFRERSLGLHADLVTKVDGLIGYQQNHTRDGAYGVGEAVLDAAYQLWFADVDSLDLALASPQFQQAEEELADIIQARYLHEMVVREHWVIGPDAR